MNHRLDTVCRDAQFVVLLDVEQGVEELALEDADDPVQAAVELLVLFSRSLGLLPLLQPEPVLLQELQSPLSIFLPYGHADNTVLCLPFPWYYRCARRVRATVQTAKWGDTQNKVRLLLSGKEKHVKST